MGCKIVVFLIKLFAFTLIRKSLAKENFNLKLVIICKMPEFGTVHVFE